MGYSKKKWLGVAGALLVSGVLFIAGLGSPGAQAAGNPLNEILDKLNQILTAINGIQQSNSTLRWDQSLPAAQRFVILPAFNNEAVLDKNTGLVWERSPQASPTVWSNAVGACIRKTVGGLKGWRLPSGPELASLVDPSVPPGLTLPPGHPFLNVQSFYWSASTVAADPMLAWYVRFGNGSVENDFKTFLGGNFWCVRGPMQESVY